MENATEALIMAFAILVFVIAMSLAIYLFSAASSTSQFLLYAADKTNYYDNIELTDNITTRVVSKETIIPTLYRYYKENFAVQIYDKNDKLVQVFDLNIEGKVRKAAGTISSARTGEQRALISLYGVTDKNDGIHNEGINPYLYEAPWIGNTNKDIKKRLDLYIGGEVGYINGTRVDYTKNNLKTLISNGPKFIEQFTEYTYKGDTITSEDGTESITGNAKPETKILITYKQK